MLIELKKFGTTLISRDDGREAFSAIQPIIKGLNNKDTLEIDFAGVNTFSPSWGDEFLTPFFKKFEQNLILLNTQNLSVQATLATLEGVNKIKFNY